MATKAVFLLLLFARSSCFHAANCYFHLQKAQLYHQDFAKSYEALRKGRDCLTKDGVSPCLEIELISALSLRALLAKNLQEALSEVSRIHKLNRVPNAHCRLRFLRQSHKISHLLERRFSPAAAASYTRTIISYLMQISANDQEGEVESELSREIQKTLSQLAQQMIDEGDREGAELILADLDSNHPGVLWIRGKDLLDEKDTSGLSMVFRAADGDVARAQAYLAGLFLVDRKARELGLRANPGKAYYWMYRASENLANYERLLNAIEGRITPEQKVFAEFHLNKKEAPPLLDYGGR